MGSVRPLFNRLSGRSPEWGDIGDPIVVATHPRSGTHLTLDLLRKQFNACKAWLWFGEALHHLYVDLGRLHPTHPHPMALEEAFDLLQRADRPTIKTHSLPSLPGYQGKKREVAEAILDDGQTLYVVRDGRDVLCSAHVWKQEDEPDMAGISLSAFLRDTVDGMSRVAYWAEHVNAWTSRPNTHVVRFEDIIRNSRDVISDVGGMLGLTPLYETPLLPQPIRGRGRLPYYLRRLRRDFESTNIVGRPNGQPPARWQDAFTNADRQFFWEEAGEVLQSFGYASDQRWTEVA
jgi:hypothetical protein